MDAIKNIFRISTAWFTLPLAAWWGSRKMAKMQRKNIKEQDPDLFPFQERWEYLRKKSKGVVKRMGIKVEVVGLENIPKGGCWITPNHTSNLDGAYLSIAFGGRLPLVPIARDTFRQDPWPKRSVGKAAYKYIKSVDGMFLDRSSPRQALDLMNGAAQYAKNHGRGIVVFPEGTRSYTTDLLDFKNGAFKFPQKYFLPIVPVTITGTLEAKGFLSLKTKKVKVIIHTPIKAIDHSKRPTEIVSNKVKNLIQKDLDEYVKSLSKEELEQHNKNKEKAAQQMVAKTARLEAEIKGK